MDEKDTGENKNHQAEQPQVYDELAAMAKEQRAQPEMEAGGDVAQRGDEYIQKEKIPLRVMAEDYFSLPESNKAKPLNLLLKVAGPAIVAYATYKHGIDLSGFTQETLAVGSLFALLGVQHSERYNRQEGDQHA